MYAIKTLPGIIFHTYRFGMKKEVLFSVHSCFTTSVDIQNL